MPGTIATTVKLDVFVNAGHAIEGVVKGSARRGEIRVATRRGGGEAVITVTDTGAGIPQEIRGRIFDPFFTTKEVGRGTGQGLAIAQCKVKKHAGRISFQAFTGAGTTFEIRLPPGAAGPATSPGSPHFGVARAAPGV
ncbi:MAG TPA: ATP-binding protein [Anaeromyxobacter sp.]|nr:ATP-binding protein [Anaeromyxobacter sp.]